MLGLEKRIGSIEVGKDADILLLDGNPLDYRTYVETAIVNGRVAYKRAEVRVLPVYSK
jgi:imidazolonepropionase-like amidohydrolase